MSTITDIDDLRDAFWDQHPQFEHNPMTRRRSGFQQNDYPADVRIAWCDFVDRMEKDRQITEEFSFSATL